MKCAAVAGCLAIVSDIMRLLDSVVACFHSIPIPSRHVIVCCIRSMSADQLFALLSLSIAKM